MAGNDAELDFNSDEFNGFYYTNEKQLKKMDDALIVAKIAEKYPDLSDTSDEATLKLAFSALLADSGFINELTETFEMTVAELFSVMYRRYSFMFSSCFVSKVHRLVSGRSYARKVGRNGAKRPR